MYNPFSFVDLYSRELFNKWQAQRWWSENYDKVMELYNVQKFNQHAVPLQTPGRSEDEVRICSLYRYVRGWKVNDWQNIETRIL